jgi:hypothetical protein
MSHPPFDLVVEAWLRVAPRVWERAQWEPDHCLNGTAVTIDALKAFGIAAKPLSVHALAINEVWWQKMSEKGGHPSSQEESDAWAAAGGHAAAIDVVPRADETMKWAGHLVAIARGVLLDSSTEQFVRPRKNMLFPPVIAAEIPDGFMDEKAPLVYIAADGSRIGYHARPEDKSYLTVSGFQRSKWNRDATRWMIAGITHWLRNDHG